MLRSKKIGGGKCRTFFLFDFRPTLGPSLCNSMLYGSHKIHKKKQSYLIVNPCIWLWELIAVHYHRHVVSSVLFPCYSAGCGFYRGSLKSGSVSVLSVRTSSLRVRPSDQTNNEKSPGFENY